MNRIRNVLGMAAGATGAAATLLLVAGTVLWKRSTAAAVARLHANRCAGNGAHAFRLDQLEGLPAPVARYLQFALTPGQPLVRAARIEYRGEFRMGLTAAWKPFTSEQHFAVRPPGFVWDAAIGQVLPLSVRVRDSYIGGNGAMQVSLAALVPVVDECGGAELNASALHRYLAETVWFPTALLPGRGVTWEAVDDTTALATISDGKNTVSLQFEFDERGAVSRVYTPARFRDIGGESVATPWAGYHCNYVRSSGMMVPMDGEVEWILPEGSFSYFRGAISHIEYEFEPISEVQALQLAQ